MKYTNRHRPLHRLAAAVFLLAGASSPVLAAHPGDPDGDFGQGGYVTSDFFGTDEQVYALAPMRDGRFVAVGKVNGANALGQGGSENVAVARYLPNGSLDPAFGSGGLFQLDIDGTSDEARAVRVMPDKGVLVGGSLSTDAYSDFGLVKLRADGTLDTAFGEPDAGAARKGWVRLDIGGPTIHDNAYAMATQHDGRIVLAGVTRVLHDNGFFYAHVAVARFTPQGDLDTSFGAGAGYVVLPTFLGDNADVLAGIALDQAGNLGLDDRIVLVGYTFARNNAFIARLNANGTIDTSFGTGGSVTLQAGSSGGVQTGVSTLAGARLDAAGRIVVLGEGNDRGLTVMRFNAGGSLDTGFGTNGRTTVKYSGVSDYDEPGAIALQGNGKIVAAGYATNRSGTSPNSDFFVVRLRADGTPDPAYGDGQGRVVAPFTNQDDGAFAVAIEPSGDAIAGGFQQRQGAHGRDYALLRLVGDPDRIFAYGQEVPGTF
jgi:uncharacterized delta-60 repeat protein